MAAGARSALERAPGLLRRPDGHGGPRYHSAARAERDAAATQGRDYQRRGPLEAALDVQSALSFRMTPSSLMNGAL